MAYASSAPDAKDAVVTVLSARPGLSTANVSRECPSNPNDIKTNAGLIEAIWVGREGDQDITGQAIVPVMKATPLVFDENYTLWVTIQVFKDDSSGTQEAATERAYTLAAEVIGAVASDPRLGLADTVARAMFHVGLGGDAYEFTEKTGRLASGGYGCQVQIGLNCSARITLS